MTVAPWSFGQARAAWRSHTDLQTKAEDDHRRSVKAAAEAERQYRRALAERIIGCHAEGAAWTVAQDLARGDQRVSELRAVRDITRGQVEACKQAAFRLAADRRDVTALIGWSMRRELSEGGAS